VEVVFVDLYDRRGDRRADLSASDDAAIYGVVDEIARRVWLSGGRVLASRRDDVPGRNSVAAILRCSL
jgi:hypothetical protein